MYVYDGDQDLAAVSGTWGEWTGGEWLVNAEISVACYAAAGCQQVPGATAKYRCWDCADASALEKVGDGQCRTSTASRKHTYFCCNYQYRQESKPSTGIEADFARLLGLDDMTRIHQVDGTRDKLVLAFGALDADVDKKLSFEEFRRVVAGAAVTPDPTLALGP
jgi:hypothetical protein